MVKNGKTCKTGLWLKASKQIKVYKIIDCLNNGTQSTKKHFLLNLTDYIKYVRTNYVTKNDAHNDVLNQRGLTKKIVLPLIGKCMGSGFCVFLWLFFVW